MEPKLTPREALKKVFERLDTYKPPPVLDRVEALTFELDKLGFEISEKKPAAPAPEREWEPIERMGQPY